MAPREAGHVALEVARRARERWLGPRPEPVSPPPDVEGEAASNLIHTAIAGRAPTMVARLGAVELGCLSNYAAIRSERSLVLKSVAFVRGEGPAFWWRDSTVQQMHVNAGFFPPEREFLSRFAELMLEDMRSVDVLGAWLPGEQQFRDWFANATTVRLRDLEPYYQERPWTEALEGRTVLVVHPFEQTIRSQYARREFLFRDPRVLPQFELKTLRAVQSIAGTHTRFPSWFEALESMAEQIAATEFDVALIGCGAYGLPLAAHVKRLGRKAVHLGGAAQILFGIKGRRWDAHAEISRLYNDFWVRPSEAERPPLHLAVEGGCYW